MTKIESVVKTYSDNLVHNGYFIVTNNYRLKWVSKWRFDIMKSQPTFDLNIDKYMQQMEDAQ